MRQNKVKRALRDGAVPIGTMMFEFNTTGVARIAAAAGADFAVFDMEHTGWGLETVRMLVATSRSTDLVPMVRVPATEYHFIARVLDMGAMGVMVPMVESGEQARRIVESSKYPPAGRRGAAFCIAHDDYAMSDITETMRTSDEEQLLLAQIETAAGLENLDAIAATEGIDLLWIGQFDLSCSLGIPGQFGHPRFLEAVQCVLDAARRHGKAAGFLACSVAEGIALIEQGFRCIAYGGDLWVYQQALGEGIRALRAGVSPS
jgi:2-keto-3-deoxy-L-rhamnonate aldolase RhmA